MARKSLIGTDALLTFLRSRGALGGAELVAGLKVSQPTLSRMIRAAGDSVITLGKTKSALYAARREIRALREMPLFRIDEKGECDGLGHLLPVAGGFAFVSKVKELPSRFYPGLPFFLQDLRPQGFMGRTFSERNSDLQLPRRIVDWSEDDYLEAICRRGADSPGNLLLGEESFGLFQNARVNSAPLKNESQMESMYEANASNALEAERPGSSAGGEQPKFTASYLVRKKPVHVIVKFSPKREEGAGKRWADLLLAEHLALTLLKEKGIASAQSRILQFGSRVYLEVERFDRVGLRGRIGTLSLGPIEDEYFGRRDNWSAASLRLEKEGLLSPEEGSCIRMLESFGGLIANTDRHFGNISFFFEPGAKSLRLAPVYDMLPMEYAPSVNRELDWMPEFKPEPAAANSLREWNSVLPWAVEFWSRVSEESRISSSFRKVAQSNAKKLKSL